MHSLRAHVPMEPDVTSHFDMGVYNQKMVFWAYLASVAIQGSLKFSEERGPMDNYLSKLESANCC